MFYHHVSVIDTDNRTRPGSVLARLERGETVDEPELIAALRSPHCPATLVEMLATGSSARLSRRISRLLVCHPSCPRTSAWDLMLLLGWHDLVEVVRNLRTPPAVRRQAERKLLQRLARLTAGERTALARAAPRSIIVPLLVSDDPGCVRALLDNPRFCETDAVRLVHDNASPRCVLEVLRHRRWGRARTVLAAALRHCALPLPVIMGLMVSAAAGDLEELVRAEDVPREIRSAAADLLSHRKGSS